MRSKLLTAVFTLLLALPLLAQNGISRKEFFAGEELINATLKTDFYKLSTDKKDTNFIPATFTWIKPDTTQNVSANLSVRLRGIFRRSQCSFAAMMLNFKDPNDQSPLRNLKHLKLVVPCEWGSDDEQYVLREYMVYKIYQLFTDLSFKVRLMRVRFEDVSGKIKPYRQYGFALEPADDMAKRNGYKEQDERKVLSEETNKAHTAFVSIFEYMIGNLDWAIPPHHNVKIMVPKDSLTIPPYIVPYDFDFSGAVNALYATPPVGMEGIEKVTERRYRGFRRSMAELRPVLARFFEKEELIYKTIADFTYLNAASKKEMTDYFKSFYTEIRDEKQVQKVFIDGARTN